MTNPFLEKLKKSNNEYGVIISLITAIIIVTSLSDFLKLVEENTNIIWITSIICLILFAIYDKTIEKNDKKQKKSKR